MAINESLQPLARNILNVLRCTHPLDGNMAERFVLAERQLDEMLMSLELRQDDLTAAYGEYYRAFTMTSPPINFTPR
jgi:hypothetical protein